MVLPASPADPDAGTVWLERLIGRFGLTDGGLLQLARARDEALLPELVACMPPGTEVVRDVPAFHTLERDRPFVLIAAGFPPDWLNLGRPLFSGRRGVVWATPDEALALQRRAPDFFDWISHHEDVPDALASAVVLALQGFLEDGGLLHLRPGGDDAVLAWLQRHTEVHIVEYKATYPELLAAVRGSQGLLLVEARGVMARARRAWWAILEARCHAAVIRSEVWPPDVLGGWSSGVPVRSGPADESWGHPWVAELTSDDPDWARCARGAMALGEPFVAAPWVDSMVLELPVLWEPLDAEPSAARLVRLIERGRLDDARRLVTSLEAPVRWSREYWMLPAIDPHWQAWADTGGLGDWRTLGAQTSRSLAGILARRPGDHAPTRTYAGAKLAACEIRAGRVGPAQEALDLAYAALPGQPHEDGQRAILDRIQADLTLSRGGDPDPALVERALAFWAENEPDHPEVTELRRIQRARPPLSETDPSE